ncbi:hypothetical protein MLD38_018680 [Melastoma candidum]|uniref:Uncharacterized protein n=1 Tax=Melastoma candidum TaxID=119954 RepID=A0ACB9QU01_9MYRT|nr:hypothetical protein MLD38_018680 [Melastoma candidum]
MGSVKEITIEDVNVSSANQQPKVVFVLGGPGSGKGTQCANIVEHFGYTHLSAGDLLRAEIKSGSENGTMIQNMIKEGKIVPSEVTIKLLQKAMQESGNDKFLIDGFPRNEENRAAFEAVTKITPEFVLFFDCSEEEMEKRLLGRNQGREDDNIETIRKRFKVYLESSLPVIEYYNSKGKVRKIDAAKPIDEVFEAVKVVFTSKDEKVGMCRLPRLFFISSCFIPGIFVLRRRCSCTVDGVASHLWVDAFPFLILMNTWN